MTVLATIAIDAGAFDLGEVLSGYETRVELTQFVPVDGEDRTTSQQESVCTPSRRASPLGGG